MRGLIRRFRSSRFFRWLIYLAILAILALAGYLWLRDSSLVAVKKVKIIGLHGRDSVRIRGALEDAAYDMTTLHVRSGELRKVVEPFPTIADVRVETHFPNELVLKIVPRRLIVDVVVVGRRIPVDLDGKILRGHPPIGELPVIASKTIPTGNQITDKQVLSELALLQAAPLSLAKRVARVWRGSHGLSVTLRKGPKIYFGGPDALAAKWKAAVRVLADSQSAGATYIDVEVPGRPAVGGKGVTPSSSTDIVDTVPVVPVTPETAPAAPAPIVTQ